MFPTSMFNHQHANLFIALSGSARDLRKKKRLRYVSGAADMAFAMDSPNASYFQPVWPRAVDSDDHKQALADGPPSKPLLFPLPGCGKKDPPLIPHHAEIDISWI